MGPQDGRTICETCNIQYTHCPGHPGHIELVVPVYYPMYFPELVRLLKLKCLCCHKFRIASTKVRHYLTKLKLLDMECIQEASQIMELANPTDSLADDLDEDKEKREAMLFDVEKQLKDIEKRYQAFMHKRLKANSSSSTQKDNNTYIKSLQREIIDGFNKLVQGIKRCENCGGFSPGFRKDGYAKIFQKPLSKKIQKSMSAMKKSYKVM
jgi:DNA-directed RNA polymerase I subunit RPA1